MEKSTQVVHADSLCSKVIGRFPGSYPHIRHARRPRVVLACTYKDDLTLQRGLPDLSAHPVDVLQGVFDDDEIADLGDLQAPALSGVVGHVVEDARAVPVPTVDGHSTTNNGCSFVVVFPRLTSFARLHKRDLESVCEKYMKASS